MLQFAVYFITQGRNIAFVRSTFTPKEVAMNEDKEREARQALVWASDYRNHNVAVMLGRQGVRTYGDVADLSPAQLVKIGLIQDEVYAVSQMLAKRGLVLRKDEDFDDCG